MNPELTAYLDRLIIPARKAYATAYADHILAGAAAPKLPKGLDSETADKIERKIRKYSALTPLKRQPIATQTPAIPDGLLHLPEALQVYASERGDAELLELLHAFVPPVDTNEGERMSDHYTPERTPAFVDTSEVDALDITDLEPSLARALALKLAKWNGREGKGSVYERRNGRRYLSRRIKCVDLNDPTVQALPNYSDLAAVVKERGVHVN